jgi:diguanylate cyclase (GGDEF)-like protein
MKKKLTSLKIKYYILLAVLIIASFIISSLIGIKILLNTSQEQIKRFKESAYESKKSELKNAVEIALKTLYAFYSQTTEEKIKEEIKKNLVHKTEILMSIIKNFYKRNKNVLSKTELKKEIIKIVGNARYGKYGYFWIVDSNYRVVMHPVNKELVGKNVYNLKDKKGKPFVREMVNVALKKGEGFVEYYWMKPGGKTPQPKISYVMLFKPFNWIIGTGVYYMDYVKDITEEVQKEALYTLEKIRFGKGNIGYFWITDSKGRLLMHPIKPELVGKAPFPALLSVKALKQKNKAFITYKWPKPGSSVPEPKLSYIARFKPWNWIVGSGIYIGDIKKEITIMKTQIKSKIKKLVFLIIISTILIVGITLVILKYFTKKTIFERLEALISKLNLLAKGEFSTIEIKPSEDEIGEIEKSVAETAATLEKLTREIENSLDSLRKGREVKVELEKYYGAYRDILTFIYEFSRETNDALLRIRDFARLLEKGELDKISILHVNLPPVFANIIKILEKTRERILESFEFLKTLAGKINQGEFELELSEERFQGVYKEIAMQLKEILKKLREVLGEIKHIAHEIAKGNFEVNIDAGKFQGDYQVIMHYLEEIIEKFKNQIAEIQRLLKKENEICQLRRLVEQDRSIEEIYYRIQYLLEEKFGIKGYALYEINPSRNYMIQVLPRETKQKFCSPEIRMNANYCRVKRTGRLVVSTSQPWGSVCEKFLHPENKSYLCIPLMFGEGVAYVLQLVGEKEQIEKIYENLDDLYTYLNTIMPVLEVKKLLLSLKEKSLKDGLTGLYNRYFLEEYLVKAAALTERRESHLGVLMADIDFFKKVNDTYGHDVGDKVLQKFAEVMLKSFRKSDVIVRFGGEEFLILLHDTDEEKSIEVAENLRKIIENTQIPIPQGIIKKTISIGVAVFPKDSRDIWEVVKCADVALYYAKKTGRNKVIKFTSDLLEKIK